MSKTASVCGTPRGAEGTPEFELAQKVVAARHLALTLVYLDEHTGLVVGVSEDSRLLARDSCVALDKDGRLPAISLHADRERGNVEQEVLGLLRRVIAEDGGTEGDSLVGVDRPVQVRCH